MKNCWYDTPLHNTKEETLYLYVFIIMKGPYNLCMDPIR